MMTDERSAQQIREALQKYLEAHRTLRLWDGAGIPADPAERARLVELKAVALTQYREAVSLAAGLAVPAPRQLVA